MASLQIQQHRPGASGAASASSRAWREDIGAGLVVFLVALPLCLGIALASGAPLASGLVTGVIGGLLVSRLSGSPLMVSGPAAGLTAIVLAAIAELGSFQAFLAAVLLSGVAQIILGLLRAGVIGSFFPSSVIRGMLAGIGLILLIKQLPYALGLPSPGGAWWQGIGQTHAVAAGLAVVSLLILVWWPTLVPASWRRVMPAPLIVVLLGAGAASLASLWSPSMALPAAAMVSLPVAASVEEFGAYFTHPDWAAFTNPAVYKVALTLAIVASLESLLSLEATDRMDPLKRVSSANRELLAQGVGNVACGLVGGLPMTGVIVRSAANVDAGGRTWRSSFSHGLCLLLAVATVPAWFNRIPLAALAAVLIYTGFKLAHPSQMVLACKRGWRDALPFGVTIVAILATNLLIGIAAGLAVSLCFLVFDSARNACSMERHDGDAHREVLLTLAEEVTFLNKARIQSLLRSLPSGTTVTVDATRSKHLDHDVVDLLHEYLRTAHDRGVQMVLKGVPLHRQLQTNG